jgi:V8-like Glu-specific endopeptidase
MDAFGILSSGCTATHIGQGLVLTAGHCVPGSVERGARAGCWKDASIQWTYRAGTPLGEVSSCVRVLHAEFELFQKDFAILAVENPPKAFVDVDREARPKSGAGLTLFGHPQKRPLEWSRYCVLTEAPRSYQKGFYFGHQCDTEPGNSGSVVIDVKNLRVVGIHNGGEVPLNYATFVVNSPLGEALNSVLADISK